MVREITAMLPKNWRKSFNSGIIIPTKRRFCNEFNFKKLCNKYNFQLQKTK